MASDKTWNRLVKECAQLQALAAMGPLYTPEQARRSAEWQTRVYTERKARAHVQGEQWLLLKLDDRYDYYSCLLSCHAASLHSVVGNVFFDCYGSVRFCKFGNDAMVLACDRYHLLHLTISSE